MATAYSVPYLPLDSPEYPQPVGIKLPLYKHQVFVKNKFLQQQSYKFVQQLI